VARAYNFQSIAGANTQIQSTGTEFSSTTAYRQFSVDFSLFGGSTLYCAFSSAIRGSPSVGVIVRVRIGGTIGVADGTIVATSTDTYSFADNPMSCSGSMAMPTGVQLVSLSMINASSTIMNFWVIYLEGRT
jgi:hypothetical protein